MDNVSQQHHVDVPIIERRKRYQEYYTRHKEEIVAQRYARRLENNQYSSQEIEALRHRNRIASQNYHAHHRQQNLPQSPTTSLESQVAQPQKTISQCHPAQEITFKDNTKFFTTLKRLRERIDALSNMCTCNVWKESYPGMHLQSMGTHTTRKRCFGEKGIHHFS